MTDSFSHPDKTNTEDTGFDDIVDIKVNVHTIHDAEIDSPKEDKIKLQLNTHIIQDFPSSREQCRLSR